MAANENIFVGRAMQIVTKSFKNFVLTFFQKHAKTFDCSRFSKNSTNKALLYEESCVSTMTMADTSTIRFRLLRPFF